MSISLTWHTENISSFIFLFSLSSEFTREKWIDLRLIVRNCRGHEVVLERSFPFRTLSLTNSSNWRMYCTWRMYIFTSMEIKLRELVVGKLWMGFLSFILYLVVRGGIITSFSIYSGQVRCFPKFWVPPLNISTVRFIKASQNRSALWDSIWSFVSSGTRILSLPPSDCQFLRESIL